MNTEKLKPFVLLCDCVSPKHTIVVYPSDADKTKELYLTLTLEKPSLWQRIKYLFGWSEWNGYVEVLLTKDHVNQLEDMAEFLNEKPSSE